MLDYYSLINYICKKLNYMSKISSISRKFLMALSGFFLMFFLLQHFSINILSVISPDAFNATSHFMGYNPLVQFVLQPVLLFGIIYHFVTAFILEFQNRNARPVKYYGTNNTGGSFLSKNMIYSGLAILFFLGLHLYDFWWHEISVKYIYSEAQDATRYMPELIEKFKNPIRVVIYILSFIFLGLHTNHGFQSAFQSVGANHPKYTPMIKKVGFLFSVVIPVGFIFIALYHFLLS